MISYSISHLLTISSFQGSPMLLSANKSVQNEINKKEENDSKENQKPLQLLL